MTSKAYKIGFFVLLVVNITLVMLFTFRPKPRMQGSNIMEVVSDKLGFSEDQKAMFAEMARDHRDQMVALNKQEHELTREYFSHLKLSNQEGPNQDFLARIKVIQEEKLTVTYTHFEEVKTVCREDQIANFDQLMDDMMRVLTGENNRPG